MNNDLISIIIPCYNAQDTIEKCVDSILNQTYTNFEVIIIDDGSQDRTPFILEKLQQKSPKIKIFSQPNHGVSFSRNRGIEESSGNYICYIDCDDYVDENYCEQLITLIEKYEADISVCRFYYKYPDKIVRDFDDNSITVLNRDQALEEIFLDSFIQSHPCGKLFRKKIFTSNTLFPNGRIAFEDYATLYKLFENSSKTVVINRPLYWYVQRTTSLSNNLDTIRSFQFFLSIMEMYDYAKKYKGIFHWKKIVNKTAKQSMSTVKKYLLQTSNINNSQTETFQKKIGKFLKEEKKLISLSVKWKIYVFLKNPKLYQKFLKLKNKGNA